MSMSLCLSLGLKQVMCRLGTGISLDQVGAYFVAARGGRGGYGNAHFVSGKNRSPKQATPGTCGEEKQYTFFTR
jgi:GTPase involved in cell partitioning and DNA repair